MTDTAVTTDSDKGITTTTDIDKGASTTEEPIPYVMEVDGEEVDSTRYHQYLFVTYIMLSYKHDFVSETTSDQWASANDTEKLEWYHAFDKLNPGHLFGDNALGLIMRKRILSVEPLDTYGYQIVATAESEEEVERYKQLYFYFSNANLITKKPIQLIPELDSYPTYAYTARKKKDVTKLEYEQLFKAEQHVIMMSTVPVVTALVLITTHLSF